MVLEEETINKIMVTIIVIVILAGVYAGALLIMKKYGLSPQTPEATIKIGCSYSSTGPFAEISQEIMKGLELWAEDANTYGIDAGGKIYGVELVCKDVKDDKVTAATAYNSMIKTDKVTFLVGPASNELSDAVIDVAEANQKPLILTFADDDDLFTGSNYKYTFMLMAPLSKQIQTTIQALQQIDPNITQIAIIYENSTYSTTIYSKLRSQISVLHGYSIVYEKSYTDNPSSLVNEMVQTRANPQVVFIVAVNSDGLAKAITSLKQADITTLKAIVVFAPETSIYAASEQVGNLMEGVIYVSQWEPVAPFNPIYAANLGLDWYGYITTEDFVSKYMNKYGDEPSYYAAIGYTAGLLLQAAMEETKSVDSTVISQALLNMHLMTFYGPIGFQGSDWYPGGYPGFQEAHDVLLVQYQLEGNNLVKVIIWPDTYATGQVLYPLP